MDEYEKDRGFMKKDKNTAENKPKKRTALKVILVLLLVVFGGVFAYSLYMVIDYYGNAHEEQGVIDDLKEYAASVSAEEAAAGLDITLPEGEGSGSGAVKGEGGEEGGTGTSGKPFVSQYAAFHDINPDYVGWLYLEGTKIDYPVMYRPDDPEYYSRRTIYGTDSRGGTPFVGPGASIDDDCFYIYGHNMSSGLFFGTLNYYMDEEFGLSHPTFTFETLTERRVYEIFAVHKTKLIFPGWGFVYYGYGGTLSEKEFDYFTSTLINESLYDFGVTPEYGDQLIVLSTCSYHVDTGRFAVIARRIE